MVIFSSSPSHDLFDINAGQDLKQFVRELSVSTQIPKKFDLLCPCPKTFENRVFQARYQGGKSPTMPQPKPAPQPQPRRHLAADAVVAVPLGQGFRSPGLPVGMRVRKDLMAHSHIGLGQFNFVFTISIKKRLEPETRASIQFRPTARPSDRPTVRPYGPAVRPLAGWKFGNPRI